MIRKNFSRTAIGLAVSILFFAPGFASPAPVSATPALLASIVIEARPATTGALVSDPKATPAPEKPSVTPPVPKKQEQPPKKNDPAPAPDNGGTPEKEPAGGGAAQEKSPNAREAFIGLLQSRQFYPSRAREKGIEGSVSLRVTLDAQGQAREVKILRSSDSGILDEAALDLIDSSLPFQSGSDEDLTMEITIDYQLKK